jgi:2-iminobutanoate/2-iminopropanoate deaminase
VNRTVEGRARGPFYSSQEDCARLIGTDQKAWEDDMAEYMGKSEHQKKRAYSPAVITQGGKTIWLAGQTATQDEQGNDISGNFEAQVKTIFSLLDKTLKTCGGSLANMVTMTVFINDVRLGDRFVEMRAGLFPSGNFPASALITVSNFARPGMLIEIQGVAVVGG